MPNESNERVDRVEANLDRPMALDVQRAEQQRTTAYRLDQLTLKLDRVRGKADRLSDNVYRISNTVEKVLTELLSDRNNICALARIAEPHRRRVDLAGPPQLSEEAT